jgi:TolB-like protein
MVEHTKRRNLNRDYIKLDVFRLKRLFYSIFLICVLNGQVISITGFKNNTSNPKNDWIGEALADNLTNDLSKVEKFQIVNRGHIKDILKEQKLNYSGMVDEKESLKLGLLVGADRLLRGDFTILNNILIVNTYFINIETGVIEHANQTEGNTSELYFLFKQLTHKVLTELNIEVDEILKLKLNQYATDNIKAIEKNYRGVIAFDRNEIETAIFHFKEAVNIDPFYIDAKTNLEKSEVKVSGGFLFANSMNEIDKKKKQRDALKIIIDKFIDNYLSTGISNQSIVTDMNNVDNIFIELELTINQNKVILNQLYDDLVNISGGDTEIIYRDGFLGGIDNYFFPNDFSEVFEKRYNLDSNSIMLYKENLDWIINYTLMEDMREYYAYSTEGYNKEYQINVLNNEKILHKYRFRFYLKIDKNGWFTKYGLEKKYDFGISSNWRGPYEYNDSEQEIDWGGIGSWFSSPEPPSPKENSSYPYPAKAYIYLLISTDNVKKITSISLKAIR